MTGCPHEHVLARALTLGADSELEQHLAECVGCRTSWDEQRAAIELARELPVPVPHASQIEETRTAILASVVRPTPSRGRGLRYVAIAVMPAAAAIAIATGAISFGTSESDAPAIASQLSTPPPPSHGTIHANPEARYEVSTPPDERVRLVEGQLDIAVRPLGPGERYRVIAGDGEVEVRGTAFHVVVHADHLVLVEVQHGRVIVRPHAGPSHVLHAGDAWRAPVHAASPPASRPPPPSHAHRLPRVAAARHDAAPREASPPSTMYAAGWTALRRRDFTAAAAAFAGVVALAPTSSLAPDAAYWRAVALARGGRRHEAIFAFRELLDERGASAHAGSASAMLGWLLVDEQAFDEAARRFRLALDDPDPAVRRSAESGLAALAKR